MVLPAPVGPTMAMVWPGLGDERERLDERPFGVVGERDVVELDPPAHRCGSVLGSAASGLCSSASRNSSTRSSEAMPDWNTFIIDASWVSGIENWREYWMNAWMSPTVIAPLATRRPPTTATSTYWTLPMNIVSGCIRLDMNWAPNDDS